ALAECAAVFDRAALIALPPELRRRYVETTWTSLPDHCRGLLVTLEYPQAEKAGPPFAVEASEVQALFGAAWSPILLERSDILADEPRLGADGLSALATPAWRLQRQPRAYSTAACLLRPWPVAPTALQCGGLPGEPPCFAGHCASCCCSCCWPRSRRWRPGGRCAPACRRSTAQWRCRACRHR